MTASIVVSAGTYHFGFDRLMDWTETWLKDHPEVRAVVQHGTSRQVQGAENHDIIDHGSLLALYRAASVVVLQGGAGGIMDARQLGVTPVVVPRVPVGDEVVDDHQLIFARRLAGLGLVHVAETERDFRMLLDQALAGSLQLEADPGAAAVPGPREVARQLDSLLESGPAARRSAHWWRRLTRTRREP